MAVKNVQLCIQQSAPDAHSFASVPLAGGKDWVESTQRVRANFEMEERKKDEILKLVQDDEI